MTEITVTHDQTPATPLRVVERLTPFTEAERTRLYGWGRNLWGSHGVPNKLACVQPVRRYVGEVEGQVVTTAGIVRVTPSEDPRLAVLGIGGVVTALEHQRHGYAQRLVQTIPLIEDVNEGRVDLVMVFCLAHRKAYYERLGFRALDVPVQVGNPPGGPLTPVLPPYHTLAVRLTDRPLPPTLTFPGGAW